MMIEAFGEKKSTTSWSKESGIHRDTIRYRINNGWNPEKAVSFPSGPNVSRKVSYGGNTRTLKEWSSLRNIPAGTLRYRVEAGWSAEEVLGFDKKAVEPKKTIKPKKTNKQKPEEPKKFRYKVGEGIPIVIDRREAHFDRACDAAYGYALAAFGVDSYGHYKHVDVARSEATLEVKFVGCTRTGSMGGQNHRYEFVAMVTSEEE